MTSGVKQALPQFVMSKAGSEGKAARSRMPNADFAETLGIGKPSGKAKTDGKPNLPEADAGASLSRLASRLDGAIDRTQDTASKLEPIIDASKDADKDEKSDARAEAGGETNVAKDPALPTTARNATDASQVLTPAPAPPPETGKAEAATQTSEPQTVEPMAHVEREIVIGKPPAAEPNSEKSFVPMGRTEPAEPIRFESATRAPTSPEQSDQAKEALPDASAEPAKPAPRITILSQQNIPAPMPSTALVLVESIAASDLLDPTNSRLSLDAIHASTTHASAQSLKIQLHPAELGMVTATLRFAGEQLSIELQVENNEAYRRLVSDSETIVGALRDLGYDVERVTVLQPSIAAMSSARSDASASMPSPQGRSAEQFGSGMANGGGGNSGGRSTENDGNQGSGSQNRPSQRAEDTGNGLFI